MRYRQIIEKAAALTEWLCLAGANWFILAFAYVAFSTLSYPFNLEWMEGQSIDIIQRILNGLPVYTKPSIDYVAYIYTPLYFYVSALVAKITGIGFLPARLVSTLSALGTGAVIYAWIRKEKGSFETGVIAAGLFFATYRLSGRWLDTSRVDSLFLFLTLLSLYLYTHYRGHNYVWLTAMSATAAFFTKQTALVVILPVLVTGLAVETQYTLKVAGALALLLGGSILLYNFCSDGWFYFFIFTVPAGHTIDHNFIFSFWTESMFRQMAIYWLLSLAVLAYFAFSDRRKAAHYVALMVGFIGASYAMRLHWGGWLNALIPAHAILALLSGLALTALTNPKRYVLLFLAYGAALVQMGLLFYPPLKLIPTQADIDCGNRFLKEIASIPGDIFVAELQFVQTRAGKKSYSFGMGGYDVLRAELGGKNYIKEELAKELREAMISQRFGGVFDGRLVRLPGMQFYRFSHHIDYPKEYVTNAIGFFRGDLSVPANPRVAP